LTPLSFAYYLPHLKGDELHCFIDKLLLYSPFLRMIIEDSIMKLLKSVTLALLSSLTVIAINAYADDCTGMGPKDYVHCLGTTQRHSNFYKWQSFLIDGQKLGPYCGPVNSFSFIPQKRGKQNLGDHVQINQQCDNQACANPILVAKDSYTVIVDPQNPNLYTSVPKDSYYTNTNPNYGDDCTPSAKLLQTNDH
jgi:hypothetical protein